MAIAREHANVRLFERSFDSLAGQSNFGIDQCLTEWVMLLDADYVLSDSLISELTVLRPPICCSISILACRE